MKVIQVQQAVVSVVDFEMTLSDLKKCFGAHLTDTAPSEDDQSHYDVEDTELGTVISIFNEDGDVVQLICTDTSVKFDATK